MPVRRSRPLPASQYSLWLLPEASSEARLLETIARLSVLLASPSFAPHVTVQGDIAQPLEALRAPLQRMAARCEPLRWPVRRVETSPHFFRCLYLRFDAQPAFTRLQQSARRQTATARGLSPFPHLSLAYGEPHADNAGLAEVLAEEFMGQEIVFDQIAIYRSSQSVPIPEWECLARHPLGGA